MTITLPRREKAAAKTGPRIDLTILQLKEWLGREHGLSELISSTETWEPFAWKGSDLSAPLRALYVAESHGLLNSYSDPSAPPIRISDILRDINGYLKANNKPMISEATIVSNLRQASLYVSAAIGAVILPDRKSMTVRFVNAVETAENIEKYFDSIKLKLTKIKTALEHAEICGYDVSRVIAASEQETGVRLLRAA